MVEERTTLNSKLLHAFVCLESHFNFMTQAKTFSNGDTVFDRCVRSCTTCSTKYAAFDFILPFYDLWHL